MNQGLVFGMKSALSQYQEIVQFIKENNPTGLLISYEKALQNGKQFVLYLKDNLGIQANPEQIENAISSINPNSSEYFQDTRNNRSTGRVDHATKETISGWALLPDKANIDSVEVILYINNQEVKRTIANQFRQDLLDRGIHPEGKCAFIFEGYGSFETKPGYLVQVRVKEDVFFLPGSVKIK